MGKLKESARHILIFFWKCILSILVIVFIWFGYYRKAIRRHLYKPYLSKLKQNPRLSLKQEADKVRKNQEKRDYRVIFCTFAGRKDRMSILNRYVLQLLKHKLIDEYHIWNLTRQESDQEWLRDWCKQSQTKNKKIRLFEPTVKQYRSFYQFYIHHQHLYQKHVIVKADDDIVYLALTEFEDFIKYRINHPEIWLLSANVINNGVCMYYQQKLCRTMFPKHQFEYPKGGLCGTLWESSKLCFQLHHWTLHNPQREKAASYNTVQLLPIGERISINCIAWMGSDLQNMSVLMHNNDDEKLISIDLSVKQNKQNAIYGPFVVSHLSFYKQEEDAHFRDYLIPTLLCDYRLSAKKQIKQFQIKQYRPNRDCCLDDYFPSHHFK
jgi:hypothetical protein